MNSLTLPCSLLCDETSLPAGTVLREMKKIAGQTARNTATVSTLRQESHDMRLDFIQFKHDIIRKLEEQQNVIMEAMKEGWRQVLSNPNGPGRAHISETNDEQDTP